MAPSPANSHGNGYPLALAGAVSAARFVGGTATVAPTTGTFEVGDFVISQNGKLWICTVAGSPGTWVSGSGSGTVTSVTATDASIVVGGTATDPTVATGRLNAIATAHPPNGAVDLASQKITSLAAGVAATDAATVAQALAGGTYILVQEQQAQNTAAGTFTLGAWRTRLLNTLVNSGGGIASLASNQITLPAGTYVIRAVAPAYSVSRNQLRLQNITDTATILLGMSNYCLGTFNGQSPAVLVGQFTLAGTKALELQHQCEATQATSGFGIACNFTTEVYATVELVKVA